MSFCSQSLEHQILAQLEGDLVPEVEDHCALQLLHALEDEPRHHPKMPTVSFSANITYDLPVLS